MTSTGIRPARTGWDTGKDSTSRMRESTATPRRYPHRPTSVVPRHGARARSYASRLHSHEGYHSSVPAATDVSAAPHEGHVVAPRSFSSRGLTLEAPSPWRAQIQGNRRAPKT
ncbi:hypothetical protein GCM10012283_23370 [Phycicoccus endophyticus]|nr:hypothetical protein GCM10012283_23370 [Phycicoccus endophyticus]